MVDEDEPRPLRIYKTSAELAARQAARRGTTIEAVVVEALRLQLGESYAQVDPDQPEGLCLKIRSA